MGNKNYKFRVLDVVGYSFDTFEEAKKFVEFLENHRDGHFVTMIDNEGDEDNEQE